MLVKRRMCKKYLIIFFYSDFSNAEPVKNMYRLSLLEDYDYKANLDTNSHLFDEISRSFTVRTYCKILFKLIRS